MTRPEKASEPSMEEILASIRKIIAEEPIGSRPGAAAFPGLPDETRSARSGGDGHDRAEPGLLPFPERDSSSDDSAYSVEDALADLIDDGSEQNDRAARREPDAGFASRPRQAAEPAGDNARPGWLFSRPSVPAPSPGSAVPAPGKPANGPANPLDMLRQAPRVDSGPQGDAGLPGAKPFSDLPLPGHRSTEPSLPPLKDEAPRPSFPDLGPKPAPSRAVPVEANISRPAPSPSPATVVKTPAGVNGAAIGAETARRPEPTPGVPAAEAAQPAPVRAPDPIAAKAPQTAAPETQAPLESRKPSVPAKEPEAKPAVSEPVRRPEFSALDALAQGLAGSKAVAKPAPDVAKPSAATAAPAAAAPEAPAAQKPASIDSVSRTLEDTVADLLRPMLRDWLDANMPRIVEKALRVELAANAQRSAKPEQS